MTIKPLKYAAVLLLILIPTSICLADIAGTWNIRVKQKLTISGGGGNKVKGNSFFTDTMTFNADHTFKLDDFGGTWTQNNRSFTVFRDVQELAEALETALLVDRGIVADITGVETKMRGRESGNGQRIRGTAVEKFDAVFPDLSSPAKIRVSSKFFGTRSSSASAATGSFVPKLIREPGNSAKDQGFTKRLANSIQDAVMYMVHQYR